MFFVEAVENDAIASLSQLQMKALARQGFQPSFVRGSFRIAISARIWLSLSQLADRATVARAIGKFRSVPKG
jgi:hypothetical protein